MYFPHSFQAIICYPTSQKNPFDKDALSNNCPISNLSLISKITEGIVKSCLNQHLSSNSLYNHNQSANTKYHSAKAILLSLHDHLIIVINLRDPSAAFDTIDNSILLHRLLS